MRDKTKEFIVEGTTGVAEALGSRYRVKALFVQSPMPGHVEPLMLQAEKASVPVFEVSESVMSYMSPATTPPGAIAIAEFVDRPAAELVALDLDLTVVLCDVRDPGNVGTILRTTWACGAGAAFLGSTAADVYNPKVVRATAGALFHLPFARDVDVARTLQDLKGRSLLVAADAEASQAIWDVGLSGPVTLILGNEAWGLPDEVLAAADVQACVPLSESAESLNVGIAAAVFLFEAIRQRRGV